MDKWQFNTELFSRLSDVLDINGTEIARRCGMRQQVFSRYKTNEIVVSVQVLVKMCNSLRVPIHYFIAEDNNFVIPNRESATIPAEYWQPVSWNMQAVEQNFGDGEGRIFWKDVASVMGVSSQKPHERFTLRRRFKVTDFLATCSHYGISPFRFLDDRNRDYLKKASMKNGTPPVKAGSEDICQRMDRLASQVGELTAKYNDLLERHKALLERHNRLENVINEYMDFGHHDVAAEDGQ